MDFKIILYSYLDKYHYVRLIGKLELYYFVLLLAFIYISVKLVIYIKHIIEIFQSEFTHQTNEIVR